MKVIGIIPARWQSSRFPGKPLAALGNKSLLWCTYENARKSSVLDELVIATDDERIFKHAQEFGATVFMTSPACPTGTDRIWEVMDKQFPQAEIIVNVQGDEPCLDPKVIDILVEQLKQRNALLTTPVAKIFDLERIFNKNVVKCVFNREGVALYFSRSAIPSPKDNRECLYYRHLGIYCFRRELLNQYVSLETTALQATEDIEVLKLLEHGIDVHVCLVEDQAIGVDTPEDLQIIQRQLGIDISKNTSLI